MASHDDEAVPVHEQKTPSPGTGSSVKESTVPSRRSSRSRRGARSKSSEHREEDGLEALLELLGDDFELHGVTTSGVVRNLDSGAGRKALRGHTRNFLIRRKIRAQQGENSVGGVFAENVDRFDYNSKYPADKPGERMGPNARVWRVYLDEAGQFDADMVDNMRDTVDIILVFAGLFSAIVTTLVALTATALQLDQPKVTNLLLMELIALQRATAVGGPVDGIPSSLLNADSPNGSTAESADYWVNGLWFTSLAFSLSTALIAMLVKQWIQAYISPTFNQGSSRGQAEVRHFRYHGIEAWHVPFIIDLLPMLLHLSLFLFFAGLILFLSTLDQTIATVVTTIASTAYAAYAVANLLPVWFVQCPYKTPLSNYAFVVLHHLKTGYSWLWKDTAPWRNMSLRPWDVWFRIHEKSKWGLFRCFVRLLLFIIYVPFCLVIRLPMYPFQSDTRPKLRFLSFLCQPLFRLLYHDDSSTSRALKDLETQAIAQQGAKIHTRMFTWSLQTSSNPSVRSIVIPRFHGSPQDLLAMRPPQTTRVEWAQLVQQYISAQITGPILEGSLHRDSFLPFVGSRLPYPHELVDDQNDTSPDVVDGLLAAHEYSRRSQLGHRIEEETYDLTSTVDWNRLARDMDRLDGETFLQRFCLHVLHHATPETPSSLPSFLTVHADLSRLYPALRVACRSRFVKADPKSIRRLMQWLPIPSHVDSQDLSFGDVGLQQLLEVAAFLLALNGTEFVDAFRDAGCLEFWRHVYDRRRMELPERRQMQAVIPLELAEAFHRMILWYFARRTGWQHQEKHRDYVFSHLVTICLWEEARQATALPNYLRNVVYMYPRHPIWQEVQAHLRAQSLRTEHLEENSADTVFLGLLSTALKKAQAVEAPVLAPWKHLLPFAEAAFNKQQVARASSSADQGARLIQRIRPERLSGDLPGVLKDDDLRDISDTGRNEDDGSEARREHLDPHEISMSISPSNPQLQRPSEMAQFPVVNSTPGPSALHLQIRPTDSGGSPV